MSPRLPAAVCIHRHLFCKGCSEVPHRFCKLSARSLRLLRMHPESCHSSVKCLTTSGHVSGSTPENNSCLIDASQMQEPIKTEDGSSVYRIALHSKFSAEMDFINSLEENVLKLPQGKIVISSRSEKEEVCEKENFNVKFYMDLLNTHRFGRLLIWSQCLPSTHTFLSENFKVLPVGTTCVADTQLQGKGRAKNTWVSPHGCLMFSFTLEMDNGRVLPFLQYVVSLAVIKAIESLCKKKSILMPNVRIKWPNDIYAEGLKIGGVLCTSTYRSKTFNITVGIGLNVDNEKPTECLNSLLRKMTMSKHILKREEILTAILATFECLFDIFLSKGFAALEESYYEKWLHSEQKVTLEEKHEQGDLPTRVSLTVKGLTTSGYLLAVDESGNKYELHPDGNSFDFFKGLVRRKIME